MDGYKLDSPTLDYQYWWYCVYLTAKFPDRWDCTSMTGNLCFFFCNPSSQFHFLGTLNKHPNLDSTFCELSWFGHLSWHLLMHLSSSSSSFFLCFVVSLIICLFFTLFWVSKTSSCTPINAPLFVKAFFQVSQCSIAIQEDDCLWHCAITVLSLKAIQGQYCSILAKHVLFFTL